MTLIRRLLSLAILAALLLACPGASVEAQPLTSRPRPKPPAADRLAADSEVRTKAGERRRLTLADGSVLFVNENTTLAVKKARQIALANGEVYVEAAAGKQADGVRVQAAGIAVHGHDASFTVRVEKAGPAVTVTRGSAQVEGVKQRLYAGQRLAI